MACLCCRHAEDDRASGSVIVNGLHMSSHGSDKTFYQGQADTGSACGAGKIIVDAVEVLEYFFKRVPGDARPSVSETDAHTAAFACTAQQQFFHRGLRPELEAVFDQVDENLNHGFTVIIARRHIIIAFNAQLKSGLLDGGLHY